MPLMLGPILWQPAVKKRYARRDKRDTVPHTLCFGPHVSFACTLIVKEVSPVGMRDTVTPVGF